MGLNLPIGNIEGVLVQKRCNLIRFVRYLGSGKQFYILRMVSGRWPKRLLDNILNDKSKSTYLYIRWSSGSIFKRKKTALKAVDNAIKKNKKKQQQQQNVTKNNKCYCLLTFILARAWHCVDLCNFRVCVCVCVCVMNVLFCMWCQCHFQTHLYFSPTPYYTTNHFSFKNSSGFHQKDKSLYRKHNI